jgi:hypothetical protein
MAGDFTSDVDACQPPTYELRLKGHLCAQWTAWFDDLEGNGVTLLTGHVFDQAALHALLSTVRDLGIQLVAVRRIEPQSPP